MSISEYPLIPKEAFLYFPQGRQICQFKSEKPYRIIFEGGMQYSSFEKEKLYELHNQIKRQKKYHHLSYVQQSTLVRFLQATKYDCDDCLQALQKYKKWEDSIFPLTLKPSIETLLKQGFLYMVGRDSRYRPILVVDVQKIKEADLQEKTFYQLLGYFFQYVLQNCLVEGQVENWITIVDLSKMGLFSLGGIVMDTIKFLSNHFRCRVHHNYLVNCPGSMTFLFGMIKKALSEDQIKKITLCEESQLPKQAFKQMRDDQIQKKYGGTKKNVSTFWPIQINHFPPSFQIKNRLISVTEYGQMHDSGQLGFKKVSKSILDEYKSLLTVEDKVKVEEQFKASRLKQQARMKLLQQMARPAWQDPPEICGLPQPFSMQQIFGLTLTGGSTSQSMKLVK